MNKLPFLKITTLLLTLAAILLTTASAWAAGSSSLVIAEVYGGGGNSGSTYQNDFIVVFNRGSANVDVNGWSVQYASASGTTWQVTPLATSSTIIPPGGYFLVQEAQGSGGTTPLPTPDATGTIGMSASNGKVALVSNSTALSGAYTTGTGTGIIDFVGFGTATGFEGAGAAPAPSASVSDQRASSGCVDTDDNAADFTTAAPNPRNSGTATHSCAVVTPPVISSIDPLTLSTNAGNAASFTVSLSMGDAPFTYYWYKETGSTTNLVATIATNTSAGTFTLPNVTLADAASYQVVVSNASTFNATSAVVSLTVTDPAINVQPVSQTGLLKGAAQFSVAAGGTGLSYQWYFCNDPYDNTQLGAAVGDVTQASSSVISGSATSTLTITNLQAADPTNFVVVVTGTYGSITSSVASLSVASTTALALWNFNSPYMDPLNPAPYQGIGTASALSVATFQSPIQDANDASFPNSSWGTQNYPSSGQNKQAGIQFNVSTVGAKNVNISYDIRGTSTASKYQRLQFTTNGTDWIDYPASDSILSGQASSFVSRSISLAGYPGVRNNPNFGIRFVTEFESTALYNNTNDASYVGVASSYNGGGTLTYDLVTISADAITDNNQPPTISAIPDQSMSDQVAKVVNFTVGDDATSAGSLGVSAASLDPSVSLSLSPANTGGSVALTINSFLNNPDIVNVPVLITVTDGNGDTSKAWFTLTINPANAAPTVTGLADTNMLPNTTLTVPFTIGDDHTSVNSMTPTATSENTAIVPDDVAHVSLGGSGASRTLTITPVANQLGTVPLTVMVNDGSLTAAKTIYLTVRPNTNVLLVENFNYGNGSLSSLSQGFWQTHSGTAGQLQINSGIATIDGPANSEDVNATLIGGPYSTNSPAVLYASFVVNFSTLPDTTGAYFAHFKDNTTYGFLARVWAATNSADGGYHVGIANSSGGDTTVFFPQNLVAGSNYVVVTRLAVSNAVSTLWINPTVESSPSVTDNFDITTNKVSIYSFALRESNTSEGIVNVSTLKVGLTFDSVLPALHLQPDGSNMIVNWSDPTLAIQATTNLSSPFTDVVGATPPYTNNASTNNVMFFRFKR